MSLMSPAGFQTLLDRRYKEILEYEYASTRDQISDFYSKDTSDSFEERRGSVGELPTWDEFGGSIPYARFWEQYQAIAVHREFAQGLRWERRLVDDDLTGIMRGERYTKMINSGIITQQQHAARLWNFIDSNDLYFYTRTEGVPLASAFHTTRTPNVSTTTGFDNILTDALSPVSYRAARHKMRRFASDTGNISDIIGDTLVVPIELEQRAMEILHSTYWPDTNENRIQADKDSAKIIVCIYWDDPNNWALVNEKLMKANCYWFDRIDMKGEFRQILDFDTLQLKASGYGRWSTLVLDWRWVLAGVVS